MKQNLKKGIKYFVLIAIVAIVGLLSYVSFALPDVGDPENITVEITTERIERGKYLANSVNACLDCHSKRDWTKTAGPVIEGTLGQGGEEFNQEFGLPGKFFAKNITPYALKDWTDGEIFRAITSGVNKDGKALFPLMPHPNYGKSDREDIYSIIAYIRTLKPIENVIPESEPEFPMNFIINTIPQKARFTKIPDQSNPVAYGAYIFNSADCSGCHTQKEKGNPIPGLELAGGYEFNMPTGGVVRSANITPDMETGIAGWTEEFFVNRFKSYADSTFKPADIKPGEFNTVMPWAMFGTMKTEDLKALYAYLRTVKPVKNKVVKFSTVQAE
ncbi:c-type cytochrome [Daejeonella sp.]|uniref:c-type cytochrome n=1 Tax=Daejeonella sp. TaxID=2805397 RepID=UPI0027242229|nr:c-type cytochrome [Daejeonella sp.]MDO8994719.1 c-type cytochrome [Daejeonella sp.]MDP2413801.1 c-type cytochrome [Daejeonella sp.]